MFSDGEPIAGCRRSVNFDSGTTVPFPMKLALCHVACRRQFSTYDEFNQRLSLPGHQATGHLTLTLGHTYTPSHIARPGFEAPSRILICPSAHCQAELVPSLHIWEHVAHS